jgi:hypothetical protein
VYKLFEPEWQWLWMALLALALFFPVRKLIWVASVRREERRQGQVTDEARRHALRRRAAVTAGLLSVIFAVIYVHYLFTPTPVAS